MKEARDRDDEFFYWASVDRRLTTGQFEECMFFHVLHFLFVS